MSSLSRRTFLKRGSLGVAAAGVAAALPAGLLEEAGAGAASGSVPAEVPEGASLTEPIVAHLKDLASGDVSVYVGTREVSVRDPGLAARLYHAAR